MALNPLIIPPGAHSLHSRTPSASSSASSTQNMYDLYNPSSAFGMGRPAHNQFHARSSSNSSATFSLATQITSPADSPPTLNSLGPNPQMHNPLGAHRPSYKGINPSVARHHSRRSRADSSPYSRTGADDYLSSASSRSSSCSDVEPDELSMYFGASPQLGGSSHHPDYNGLFVGGHPSQVPSAHYGLHGPLAGHPGLSMSQLDANGATNAFGNMSLDTDQTLEQLAANVRSSTTTTASDRAKQIFVQAWLTANYAPYPDGNVPRQGLYNSYRRVCDQYNIPHINTATLGKAIRLCFPNIKTRRLGVRGNSKYHYCGIRPATLAEAEWLQDFVKRTTNHSAIAANSRRGAAAAAANASGNHGSDDEDEEDSEGFDSSVPQKEPQFTFNNTVKTETTPASNGLTIGSGTSVPHPLTLGGGLKSPTLFSMVDDKTPTTNTLLSAAQAQGISYGTSQAQIRGKRTFGSGDSGISSSNAGASSASPRPGTAGSGSGAPAPGTIGTFGASSFNTVTSPVSVRNLPNFPRIEEALGIEPEDQRPSTSASSSSNTSESKPTATSPQHLAAIEVWKWFEDHLDGLVESVRSWRFDQFEIHLRTFWASLSGDYREVVHAPAVAGLMVKADAIVYNEILETLRSQMLSPIQPQALTSLRQLAEKMEKILLLALENYGNTFVEPKVELGARFGHLVLRFLDMFQVTQALNSVLTNKHQMIDMRRAWGEIDFESVRNQAALVCNCRHEDLNQLLEVDFVALLDHLVGSIAGPTPTTTEPVREIMNWADACCERLMAGGAEMSSRSILIRWGYVTSQVMRDLTIRSDPAFGAFQIMKLFLDDWIALNVLRSVALSTNSVQASVEPPMPQQYLALSPMAGQEFTGPLNASNGSGLLPPQPNHMVSTSSVLGDGFGATSTNGTDSFPAFSSLSYGSMDATAGSHNATDAHSTVDGFSDYQQAPSQFDITSFLAASSVGTPGVSHNSPGTSAPSAVPDLTNGTSEAESHDAQVDVDIKDESA